MIRTYTTRIEDKNIHEVETCQDDAGVITHVNVTSGGHTLCLTALEASAIAEAINDHLGNRAYR
jgi:hypothetical protein